MCKLCEIKSVYEFTNQRKLCKNCFVKWFEKKFLYINRKFGMIKKGDVVFLKTENDFRGVVLKYILEKFENKFMIKLKKNRANKIAIASTIDFESEQIIKNLIKGNLNDLKKLKPVDKNTIKPLYLFLDKEVLLYAKLKKLKFRKIGKKKNEISDFLDGFEKKHPEVKQAVVSSFLEYDI